jgi:hypothetical protein
VTPCSARVQHRGFYGSRVALAVAVAARAAKHGHGAQYKCHASDERACPGRPVPGSRQRSISPEHHLS